MAARHREDADAAGIAEASRSPGGRARPGNGSGANPGRGPRANGLMMGDMDHSDVRELLEDAAIEPGGLERLMAGDTPSAAIVAGHVAGCPDCAEELDRLRRTVGAIRPAVRAVPPPELRQRTLDYVAALGRPRGADLVPAAHSVPLGPAAAPAP